jgi:hypothetical protein
MKCRKSVAELTVTEKQAYVAAVLALKNPALAPSRIPDAATLVTAGGGMPNRYDDYVWMHNVIGGGAHRGPAFGPWHREFLRQFEFDLQQVSGDPEMAIPYWDWTTDQSPGSTGWPFTGGFMGGFGNILTGMISTGLFSNPAIFRMNIRRPGDNDLTLKRSRGIPSPASLPVRADVLPALGVGIPPGGAWPTIFDASPFHSDPTTQAEVMASFRKYLEYLLHNGIHVWIGDIWDNNQNGGHMTFPPVAVNDPMFWLHHANVDRLWGIWQRKSPTPGYVPLVAGTANNGHNGPDIMARFNNPAHFNSPPNQHPVDVLDYHAIGYWYHSDIPVITLSTPSVSFGNVPENLTTFRPVQFAVRTCQPVNFRITAISSGNFSAPAGQGTVTVDHSHTTDVVTADIYVQFQALGAVGVAQPGSVTVEATINDVDGYDTPNPGNPLVVGTWTINLAATPVSRPQAAVSFVLDRSGSMSESAGVAGTKYDMLKSSLQVVADIMRDTDGVGLVSFDDAVTTLNGITAMGPSVSPPVAGSGRAAVVAAIGSPDLVPRGWTGIGQGMISGAAVLDAERTTVGTPYSQFAMLVMTDGNQNVSPAVTDPPVTAAITPYQNTVYAVGLGTPGNVSDTTLGAISQYMLVTGDVTAAERRFRLTKYFIQILAGVTRLAIVVDPQGDLHIGSEHVIPFFVSEADVEIDVIVLCPIAPLLEFELEAPDGTRIDSSTATPTVIFRSSLEDAFYRLSLPIAPGARADGQWKAILRLTEESLRKQGSNLEKWAQLIEGLRKTGTLPYSLIVQSYTNLQLEVFVKPTLALAGETINLYASLLEYGLPLTGRAEVEVRVTDPQGLVSSVQLQRINTGYFAESFVTSFAGLYQFHFLARGSTRQGTIFQREETRSVSVFRERIPDGRGDLGDDKDSPDRTRSDKTPPYRSLPRVQKQATGLSGLLHVIRIALSRLVQLVWRLIGRQTGGSQS